MLPGGFVANYGDFITSTGDVFGSFVDGGNPSRGRTYHVAKPDGSAIPVSGLYDDADKSDGQTREIHPYSYSDDGDLLYREIVSTWYATTDMYGNPDYVKIKAVDSLMLRRADGQTTKLDNPVTAAAQELKGWPWASGPDAAGNVMAWTANKLPDIGGGVAGSGVVYRNSSTPEPYTTIDRIGAVTRAGTVFGSNTIGSGSSATNQYKIVRGGQVADLSGWGTTTIKDYVDASDGLDPDDDGYLLFSYFGGTGGGGAPTYPYAIWHDGTVDRLNASLMNMPRFINSSGVVVGVNTYFSEGIDAPFSEALIRYPDGVIQRLEDVVDLSTTGLDQSYIALHGFTDECHILASGVDQHTEALIINPWMHRFFVVELPSCESARLAGGFTRVDGGPTTVHKDEDADATLRIKNISGQQLTGVELLELDAVATDAGTVDDESGGAATLTQVGPGLPATLVTTGSGSEAFVDVRVHGDKAGKVMLTAKVAITINGQQVIETIETLFTITEDDLVINMVLDPPDYQENEDGTFDPVDIDVKVSFTNAAGDPITKIKLTDLNVVRTFSGQQLYVTYKSGINPDPIDPDVLVESLAPGETSQEFDAVFTATQAGAVDFRAMATGKLGDGDTAKWAVASKKVRWKAKAKKYIEIKTEVVTPAQGELLPAGSPVTIDGTVENLTTDYKITLGPLFAQLKGNTGTMSLAYDGPAPDPATMAVLEPVMLELEPGEKRTFQLRFTTNYSDPRMYGAQPSGGTRAYATFEPWGEAVEVQDPNDTDPPERVNIRTYEDAKPGDGRSPGEEPDAQVKATVDDLFRYVSIDDSIELPSHSYWAVAGGIVTGSVEGLANAVITTIYAIPDLVKMPYTILRGLYEYQYRVWDGLTEAERDELVTNSIVPALAVLKYQPKFAAMDTGELYQQLSNMAYQFMTNAENEWVTGDYVNTTRVYTAFLSEQIGSILGPILITKLTRTPKAAAALERWQAKINASAASVTTAAKEIKYLESVLPLLQSIENGVEPTLEVIRKLWGVSAEEIAEYQRICKVIGCVATIRSRHASSLEWIKKLGALLKPESLKIKTVSELDVLLGYDFADLGSLVFKKPEFLRGLTNPTEAQLETAASNYAKSKGFRQGTTEYAEAMKRLESRAKEWNKWEEAYKAMDAEGWIDVSFNYEGNAIPEIKYDVAGNPVALTDADKIKYKGFRMREKNPGSGSEEYIVEMLDDAGEWRRVTGDIDPVDFTYSDGSPLSPADHAKLIQLLQESPIGAEHGYSATFKGVLDPETGGWKVEPGPEFVKSQFKPNEAALQISPEGPPRATRLDVSRSRWVDPYDYNLHWVNGFVDAGTSRSRGVADAVDARFDTIPQAAPKRIALPVYSKPQAPTVGMFEVMTRNNVETLGLIMGANGRLQSVNPDGTTQDWPLHDQAFSEGPRQSVTVAPASRLVVSEGPSPAPRNRLNSLPVAPLVGPSVIELSDVLGPPGGVEGFAPGQVIAIGVGGDDVELATILAVDGEMITLAAPLVGDHADGEVVAMVVTANGIPVNPARGLDVTPGDDTHGTDDTDGTGGHDAGAVDDVRLDRAPSSYSTPATPTARTRTGDGARGDGRLPRTGSATGELLMLAITLVVVGIIVRGASGLVLRRRRSG